MVLVRRSFLKGAAAFSASAAIITTGSFLNRSLARDLAKNGGSPLGINDDLANPPELQSEDGQLRAKLWMDITQIQLPTGPAKLRIFNGSVPGPTLRVSPGDVLEVAFENRMPPNPDDDPTLVNTPNRFNTTNVHYHGFHVSPRGNSDNVYLQIEPGQRFNYIVKIPEDHPAGNYWYHPHRHGSVAAQVASGAAGMAVVRGTLDDVPEIKEAVERIMVLQAPIPGLDGILTSANPIWPLDAERNFLINGQYKPRIYMREGEVQHWRMLHAADAQFFPFRLDGLSLHEVGRDGNPLKKAFETDEVHIAPGNRVNVLVKAEKAGSYTLRRPAFNQGKASLPAIDLAEVIVLPKDDPRVADGVPFGRAIPQGDLPANKILTPITDGEISKKRKMILGVAEVKGFFHDTEFTINGKPFDPKRDDVVAKVGTAEEWTFINATPFPHPIHIHVNPFQVTDVNGKAIPDRPWHDTYPVPAAGTMTMRTRFTDFHGRYVMHCHILPHEDTGMMINVNIEA